MSDDIVERLRDEAAVLAGHAMNCGSAEAGVNAVLASEAADEIERLRASVQYLNDVIDQRNAMLRRAESDLATSEANLAALQARWDARPVAGFTDVYGNSLRVSDSCTDCGCARGQHEHGTGLCGVAGCACDGYVPYEGRT